MDIPDGTLYHKILSVASGIIYGNLSNKALFHI